MLVTHEVFKALLPKGFFVSTQMTETLRNLNLLHRQFNVTSQAQKACFLAHVFHESIWLSDFTENLNYSTAALIKTWRVYRLNPHLALLDARKPEKIGNRAYGGRMGNGPVESGDGYRYLGRGPFQVTGKDNYRTVSKAVFGDATILLNNPDRLLEPWAAAKSALWFWDVKGMDSVPFVTREQYIRETTQILNGGQNGYEDRLWIFNHVFTRVSQ